MRFTNTVTYNASLDEVTRMMTSADYYMRHYEEMNAKAKVDVNIEGNAATITSSIQIRPEEVPDKLLAFLRDSVHLNLVEVFQLTDSGLVRQSTVSVGVKGVPVTVNAQTSFTDNGDNVVRNLVGNMECAIPLIGKTVEKYMNDFFQQKVSQEEYWAERFIKEMRDA